MRTIAVIIPAHNEQSVIERCLQALFASAEPGEVRAWVVANACSDATAERAQAFGAGVEVIETIVPSKTNALNLGDAAAVRFPRVYVDADVVLSTDGLRQLCAALEEPGILAVSPLLELDYTNRPWTVRAFYEVWRRLPYCRTGISGAGVYALSEAGRRRFEQFPQVTADDAFVRMHFAPQERKTIASCRSIVTPPATLGKIIDIKTRSHFGNAELRRQYPHLWKNEPIDHKRALLRLATSPRWWPALSVYLYVKLATRLRVWQRFRRGDIHTWERDDSSRQAAECLENA